MAVAAAVFAAVDDDDVDDDEFTLNVNRTPVFVDANESCDDDTESSLHTLLLRRPLIAVVVLPMRVFIAVAFDSLPLPMLLPLLPPSFGSLAN